MQSVLSAAKYTPRLGPALLISEEFIGGDPVSLLPSDNTFHGRGLPGKLRLGAATTDWATVFACYIDDTERYGVLRFDDGHERATIPY